MSRPTDIIVGGGGDRLFKCAKRYADTLAAAHPERDIIYLPQGQRRELIRLLLTRKTPNVIGHSWGAADVSWAIRKIPNNISLRAVIGVDPVGKPGLWRAVAVDQAEAVITVRGTGSEGRLADGNVTAKIGRMIGHECPPAFMNPLARCIDAPFAHYDMTRMMRHKGADGWSAEDWALDCH